MERLHQFEAARMRNEELKEKSERILELELQVSSMKAQEEYSKNLIAIRNKEMELKIQRLTLENEQLKAMLRRQAGPVEPLVANDLRSFSGMSNSSKHLEADNVVVKRLNLNKEEFQNKLIESGDVLTWLMWNNEFISGVKRAELLGIGANGDVIWVPMSAAKEATALAWVKKGVSHELRLMVMEHSKAQDAYYALREQCGGESDDDISNLINAVDRLILTDGGSMNLFITKLRIAYGRLKALGNPQSELMVRQKLLSIGETSSEWEEFVSNIRNAKTGDNTPQGWLPRKMNSKEIMNGLLAESRRRATTVRSSQSAVGSSSIEDVLGAEVSKLRKAANDAKAEMEGVRASLASTRIGSSVGESYETRNEDNSSQYDREFEFESYEDWVEAMNYGLSSEEYYAWYDSTNQWAEGDDHWVEGNGY